jgi:hypothetical protein
MEHYFIANNLPLHELNQEKEEEQSRMRDIVAVLLKHTSHARERQREQLLTRACTYEK